MTTRNVISCDDDVMRCDDDDNDAMMMLYSRYGSSRYGSSEYELDLIQDKANKIRRFEQKCLSELGKR